MPTSRQIPIGTINASWSSRGEFPTGAAGALASPPVTGVTRGRCGPTAYAPPIGVTLTGRTVV